MKRVVRQCKNRSCTLALSLFLMIVMKSAIADNYVKVATIGKLPTIKETKVSQEMVVQVINFWKDQLQQVIYDKPDLIVLPEHCGIPDALYQTDKRIEYVKLRKDQLLHYFQSAAKSNHCYIAFGTLREDSSGNLWNSVILVGRNGDVVGIYNKNFPTIGEIQMGIRAGTKTPLFQCDFGNVGLTICFDLNFDELKEKYAALKPDIILMCSSYHGGFVQQDWAYSCRSFFVGAISGGGPSEIRDPLGEVISSSTNYFDYAVGTINLDSKMAYLDENWGRLTALKKKYGNGVTITDPGYIGAILISSNKKDVTIDQMIKEFHIELIDHYFNRSREYRLLHGIKR